MAYYKFKDGTTSLGLEKKEHFELLSNSNLWVGISVAVIIIIFIIAVALYLKKLNSNKQNFGFRFY